MSRQAPLSLWTTGHRPGGNPWTPAPPGRSWDTEGTETEGTTLGREAGKDLDHRTTTNLVRHTHTHPLVSLQVPVSPQVPSPLVSPRVPSPLVSLFSLQGFIPFVLSPLLSPGPKPMHQQESNTWCGEEVSCQSSWEPEEEVEIGMWSNAPSHRDRERDGHRENHRDRERDGHGQDNRNNGPQQHSWNYMKKIPPKVLL